MATKVALKLACFAVLACMLISSPTVDAISCGQVTSYLAPCIKYLTNKGGRLLPPACCISLRGLIGAARSTPDRKIACGCMKSAAASISGLNYGKAGSLPHNCGVNNIPYKFNPSTDCSRVT